MKALCTPLKTFFQRLRIGIKKRYNTPTLPKTPFFLVWSANDYAANLVLKKVNLKLYKTRAAGGAPQAVKLFFLKQHKTIIKFIGCFNSLYVSGGASSLYLRFIENNIKYCFIMPFLLNLANKDLPDEISILVQFCFAMFIACCVLLYFFTCLFGYIITVYIIDRYKINERYPKLNKFVDKYQKVGAFVLLIDGGICLLIILLLIGVNGYFCSYILFKLW